jgi:hypothetical protein
MRGKSVHGVVNKAIECFLRDTYTPVVWDAVVAQARLPVASFEAMLTYDPAVTGRMLAAAADRIGKPREALLEDLGIYLVSHPRYEALRRLLRFAGVTFEDFILSLDELPGRARLALPDLEIVPIRVHILGPSCFEVCCGPGWPGFGYVLAGGIRAMADDYGALVTLSLVSESAEGLSCIELTLHATNHSRGRSFDLTARTA